MSDQILFISDLHLDPTQPELTQLFLEFLDKQAAQANTLYILGDLFEVWMGDDNTNQFNNLIKTSLKQLTAKGVPVYFMPGNRDFLIGKKFAKETGCQLLTDPTLINLYGIPTLLMHGDSLCSDDVRHQRFRRFSQNAGVRALFLFIPLTIRKMIANKIRNTSKARTKILPLYAMDVSQSEVEKIMQQNKVTQLIHGHTHQPNIHLFSLDGKMVKRLVLGAWHKQGNVLICRANSEPELKNF